MGNGDRDRPVDSGEGTTVPDDGREHARATCRVPSELLWSWIDRDAPELDPHLAMCSRCRALAAELRSGIRRLAPVEPPPPPRLPLPERIGACRIIREIDHGGMGAVYLAVREDDHFKRHVAVKVLKRGLDTDDVLRRFELERQLLAALNHPGIARLFDAGETAEGLPFFVMEYIEGQPLDVYCDRHRLPIRQRLELFRKVCAAVQYAHQNLVVHRDVKPTNILVTPEGEPKLLDFGIAKLVNPELSLAAGDPTAPERRVMTPEYASPEQVRGDPTTTASDVYSLGVVLYELLTGHRPYHLRTRGHAEIERVVCEEDPEKPSTAVTRVEDDGTSGRVGVGDGPKYAITPESVCRARVTRLDRLCRRLAGDLDNIVLMAMRKEPQRRYASAEQLAEDIRRHLEGLPVIARPDTFGYRTAKFVGRNRAGVAAAAAVVLLLAGGTVATSWGWLSAVRQREITEAERDRADRSFGYARELASAFIYDFHEEIKRLEGSVPAQRLLVSKAREYLDKLSREPGADAELRRELAAAYDHVGSVQGGIRGQSEGDQTGALENYQMALEIRRGLAAAVPDDPSLQSELATSYLHVGDMRRGLGDVDGALDAYRQMLRICESLVAADAASADRRRSLALALGAVGAAHHSRGSAKRSQEYYDRAAQIIETLAAQRPDDRTLLRQISVSDIRVGYGMKEQGDPTAALDRYERALGIRRDLDAALGTATSRRDVAVAEYYLADALLTLERPIEALEHLGRALAINRSRVEQNPDASARARFTYAADLELAGVAHARLGEWDLARERYESCQDWVRPLAKRNPEVTRYTELLARSHERIGAVHAARSDVDAAITSGERALAIVEPPARVHDRDVSLKRGRAHILLSLGSWLERAGRVGEAQTRLETARDLYEQLHEQQPEHVEIRRELGRTLHELARVMLRRHNAQAAVAHAERARALRGEPDPELLCDLAHAYHRLGETRRASQIAEEAIDLFDEVPATRAELLREILGRDPSRPPE